MKHISTVFSETADKISELEDKLKALKTKNKSKQ
jgi:hypothetical protein